MIFAIILPIAELLALTEPNSCVGGRSVRGLTELSRLHWPTTRTSISCCDETVCHGGLALKDASFISPVGDSTFRRYAQALESNDARRHKRYSSTPTPSFMVRSSSTPAI